MGKHPVGETHLTLAVLRPTGPAKRPYPSGQIKATTIVLTKLHGADVFTDRGGEFAQGRRWMI